MRLKSGSDTEKMDEAYVKVEGEGAVWKIKRDPDNTEGLIPPGGTLDLQCSGFWLKCPLGG